MYDFRRSLQPFGDAGLKDDMTIRQRVEGHLLCPHVKAGVTSALDRNYV